jgi:D-beta-D-heptose 7-phosphate kinase/D-beta-D-heptose 1-phosphate adenosyltransferase
VEDIAGADTVLANGGRVEVLEFVNDCSTSNMINKIKTS